MTGSGHTQHHHPHHRRRRYIQRPIINYFLINKDDDDQEEQRFTAALSIQNTALQAGVVGLGVGLLIAFLVKALRD